MDPWRPADPAQTWPPPPPVIHPPNTTPPRRRWTRLERLLVLLAVVSVVGAAVVVVVRVDERRERSEEAMREFLTDPGDLPLVESGVETWIRYNTRAGDEDITWRMPYVFGIDGPRDLKNIPPPAIATFWTQTGPSMPLRHDAMFLHDLDALGPTDELIGRRALDDLNGDSPITIEALPVDVDGRVELHWTEVYDERVYLGHAWSWDGYLFSVDVAYHEGQPDAASERDARNAAYRDLQLLVESVEFSDI